MKTIILAVIVILTIIGILLVIIASVIKDLPISIMNTPKKAEVVGPILYTGLALSFGGFIAGIITEFVVQIKK